jgi:SAM-dependent methyltransferase
MQKLTLTPENSCHPQIRNSNVPPALLIGENNKCLTIFRQLYKSHNRPPKNNADNFIYHFREQFANIDFTGKKVLEVGCGHGFLSLYIALFTNATGITAIDESAGHGAQAGILNTLRNNVLCLNLENRLQIVETDALKFNSDRFDIIIANNCLHHFVNRGQIYWTDARVSNGYQNMFRYFNALLTKGGQLIIQEIDPQNIWRFLLPKMIFPDTDWPIHPPLSGWLDAINKAGFYPIKLKTGVPYKLRFLKPLLQNRLFRPFMRGAVHIFCSKPQ